MTTPATPEKLSFLLTAFDSGDYWEVTWLQIALRYRKGLISKENQAREIVITPGAAQWARFWSDLDRIGVWDWKPDYSDPGVLDGQGWQLEITHAGRTLNTRGDNGYPGGVDAEYDDSSPFGQFLTALRNLTGIKDIR
jgi:hypothetical protein